MRRLGVEGRARLLTPVLQACIPLLDLQKQNCTFTLSCLELAREFRVKQPSAWGSFLPWAPDLWFLAVQVALSQPSKQSLRIAFAAPSAPQQGEHLELLIIISYNY